MKRIFFLILLLFPLFTFSQNKNLINLIKVWNFLKYYHPDLASGKIDADSLFLNNIELFKVDPNEMISTLTKNLNNDFDLKTQNTPSSHSDVLLINQNFDWYKLNNSINKKSKEILNSIYSNRFKNGDHYFIPSQGFEPVLPNEKDYKFSKTEHLPLNFRLLTVAKIIGAIDYLYPHKYLMSENAELEIESLSQQAYLCTSRMEFERILAEMVALFEDTHSFNFYQQLNYKNEIYNRFFYAPFNFKILNNRILITEIIDPVKCAKAKIKIGDEILKINDSKVEEIVKQKHKLLSVSNYEGLIFQLTDYQNNLIWNDKMKTKTILVKRDSSLDLFNTQIDFMDPKIKDEKNQIEKYIKNLLRKKDSNEINLQNVEYVRLDQTFKMIENAEDHEIDPLMDSIFNSFKNKEAIIFDNRNYPDWGGFVYHYIYKSFSKKDNFFGKYYQQNLKEIGTFIYNKDTETYFPKIDNKKHDEYTGKVFIIVNEGTLSAGEWATMNLQNIFPKAITLGQKTAGADGDIKILQLPAGYKLQFTGNGIFYPDNTQTQKTGIKITHPIHYKKDNILNNENLELKFISQNLEL